MTYKIIYGETLQDLTDGVQQAITQGWQPLGGICVVNYSDFIIAYQAIIHTEIERLRKKGTPTLGPMID